MDQGYITLPPLYLDILEKSQQIGFPMLSDVYTGSFLRTLESIYPFGRMGIYRSA